MTEQSYGKQVKQGRKAAHVEGLKRFACDTCAGELVSRAQLKENNRLIDEAINREVAQCVGVEDLRALRERHNLTQREASSLFGAGESSFAKWESGQCSLSTPAALLVRCALDIPHVVPHLAELRGHTLHVSMLPPPEPSTFEWALVVSEVVHNVPIGHVRNYLIHRSASHHVLCSGAVGLTPKNTTHQVVEMRLDVDIEDEWVELDQLNNPDATQPGTAPCFRH